jgi:hypothetical protein
VGSQKETQRGCTKIVQCCISVQRDYLHAGLDFRASENVQGSGSLCAKEVPENTHTEYERTANSK